MSTAKKLRFEEPLIYGEYISAGGQITPISLIQDWFPTEPPDINDHRFFKIIDGELTKF